MVNIKINGQAIQVEEGTTVLEAARGTNIDIPTLCYLKDINEIGACRMCVVEIKGMRALQAACVYPVSEGLEVETNNKRVRDARRVTLELILSNHDRKCLTCPRNTNCELQALSDKLNIKDIHYSGESPVHEIDNKSVSIVRDPNKCILCRRCVSVCKDIQNVAVIDANDRGFKSTVGCAFDKSLADVPCINCGQCIMACPVGALTEKDDTDRVWEALSDPTKTVIVQTAPAIRVALGEEFGMPIGTNVTGKMAAALRRVGFAKVFDTDNAADFTIMEEGTELLGRIQKGENLPVITSCSPGWIKFCEHNYPEFIKNLSSAKSPQAMMGALVKSYWAEKNKVDPKDIFMVSIMPCSAKKFEVQREELSNDGNYNVDASLTSRECARMIKQAGIDFVNLEDETFDSPFGESTGAAVIFGATGGVMEAALRTVADILTGKDLENIDYEAVRGTEGIKEASLELAGKTIRVAVAHGLANSKKLLEKIKAGEKYDFVEMMACPGGCVTGGGQPIVDSKTRSLVDVKKVRADAIYQADKDMPIRKSHKNEEIMKVYKEFLGEPCGHKSHELLHTHYHERENY